MSIRPVKQQSDRGSIKDLQAGDDEKYPATSYELRLRDMYSHAVSTRDQSLIDSTGFIVLNGTVNPVSLFRHREYVVQLENRLGNKLEKTKQEIADCFTYDENLLPNEVWAAKRKRESARNVILNKDNIKFASAGVSYRSFRRVS